MRGQDPPAGRKATPHATETCPVDHIVVASTSFDEFFLLRFLKHTMKKFFHEQAVKHNPKFFLAGRGGETNLHKTNCEVRRLVLENAETYASLSAKERGQKFSRRLLEDDLAGYIFVVKLSYFWKNYENGKIAANKLDSVITEHGSIEALKALPTSAYVKIGEGWCLNIVGAILRQASCKLDKAKAPTQAKSKSYRRRACSKRNTRANKQVQDDVQDEASQTTSVEGVYTPLEHPEAADTTAPSPSIRCPTEQADSSSSNTTSPIPEETLSQPTYGATKEADPATSVKARRVSFCWDTRAETCSAPVQPMSLREAFFPLREHDMPEQAVSARFVSFDAIPEVSPSAVVPADSHHDLLDPFDLILKDWDTDKWPQLDLHDLLSV